MNFSGVTITHQYVCKRVSSDSKWPEFWSWWRPGIGKTMNSFTWRHNNSFLLRIRHHDIPIAVFCYKEGISLQRVGSFIVWNSLCVSSGGVISSYYACIGGESLYPDQKIPSECGTVHRQCFPFWILAFYKCWFCFPITRKFVDIKILTNINQFKLTVHCVKSWL